MNERPVSRPALLILFLLGGIIQRELDIVKGTQFMVFQNRNTVTVGSDGEFGLLRSQVSQYCFEIRMHAVLTGAEIHRPYRQAFHDSLHLIEEETVCAARIAVAEGAG